MPSRTPGASVGLWFLRTEVRVPVPGESAVSLAVRPRIGVQSRAVNTRVLQEELSPHTDARGWVMEPIPPESIPAQHNVHVVITEPGCVRGNHFHQRGTEITVLQGPALVRIREGGEVREVQVQDGELVRFTFPPGIAHAFKNTGSRATMLVAFNTVAHDPAKPDVVRDVLIES